MNRPTESEAAEVRKASFKVSSYTGGSGNCVGVATAGELVGVHDTKAGRDVELLLPRRAFRDFVQAVATDRIVRR